MDSDMLALSSDIMATASGYCLTTEQRALLPPSLEILKREQGFPRVVYWGKIQAQAADYLIAQGLGEAKPGSVPSTGEVVIAEYFESVKAIPKKCFRLSPDGVSWTPLPIVDEGMQAKMTWFQTSLRAKGKVFEPLKGDPHHKIEFTAKTGPPAEGSTEPTDVPHELLEEERLACMINEIDEATSVVPVGSYVLTASQQVVANTLFKGLSLSEGLNMRAYLHLRTPHGPTSKDASEMSAMTKTREYLDKIADDELKGGWTLKHDAANNIIILRSLLYPGYIHFNVIGSPCFGSVYVGTGLRSWDISFML